MPTVFVHGIAVRGKRFDELVQVVKAGLAPHRKDPVDGFYWGDMASSLRYGGASIPEFQTGRRAFDEAIDAASDEHQLGILLLDDPLVELRLLKDPEDFNPSGAGFEQLPDGIEERNSTLASAAQPVAAAIVADVELAAAAGRSINEVEALALVTNSFDAAGRTDRALSVTDLIDPLARAITASLYGVIEGAQPTLDPTFKWVATDARVQALLEAALAGQRNLIVDKLKSLAGGAASRSLTFAMRHGLRKRVMQSMSIFVGDVLAYMATRSRVQDALEEVVARALAANDGPLTLIGHSLGGIICFDYCLTGARTVDRFVSVGSQVGLFAELGAFPALVAGANGKLGSPGAIKKWINIYDPNDMLSFLAAPVFTNVTDVNFDTKAPFPVAHSEYWNLKPLYAELLR